MIYPSFLQPGDLIGVPAPSAGVAAEDIPGFELSLAHIEAAGWRVKATASVRHGGLASAPAPVRAAELNALWHDPEVKMVWCAAGGDFLVDMLPLVDFAAAAENPKWVQGYSDPTSLLYTLTTKWDIATLYGTNAGGMDVETLAPFMEQNLALLAGEVPVQRSFENFSHWSRPAGVYPIYWETPRGEVHVKGRLIGGCMDCLSDILGTPYDGTAQFVERYAADGILWYFDVFALSAEAVYRTLWKMKECGWFQNTVGVIFGRVCLESSPLGLSYREMIEKALPDLPLVLEADVGHVPPRMTVINGALATLDVAGGKGTLTMELV